MGNPFQEVRKYVTVDILPEDKKRLSDYRRLARQLRMVLMVLVTATLISFALRAFFLGVILTCLDLLCAGYWYSSNEDFRKALYDILFERCNATHAQSAYFWNGLHDSRERMALKNLFRFALALYYGGRYEETRVVTTIMRIKAVTDEDRIYLLYMEDLLAFHNEREGECEQHYQEMTRLVNKVKVTPFIRQLHMECQLFPLILHGHSIHHYESVYQLYENALVLNETRLGRVKKDYHMCVCAEAMGDFSAAARLKENVLRYGGNLRYVRDLEKHEIHPAPENVSS